jgi:hypothetical protein
MPDAASPILIHRRRSTGQPYSAAFDDMTWPLANDAIGDVEWVLRYAPEVSGTDRFIAASVLAAYRELVHCPRAKREAVIRRLRQAEREFPCKETDDAPA